MSQPGHEFASRPDALIMGGYACISGPGTARAEADVIAMLGSLRFWS